MSTNLSRQTQAAAALFGGSDCARAQSSPPQLLPQAAAPESVVPHHSAKRSVYCTHRWYSPDSRPAPYKCLPKSPLFLQDTTRRTRSSTYAQQFSLRSIGSPGSWGCIVRDRYRGLEQVRRVCKKWGISVEVVGGGAPLRMMASAHPSSTASGGQQTRAQFYFATGLQCGRRNSCARLLRPELRQLGQALGRAWEPWRGNEIYGIKPSR